MSRWNRPQWLSRNLLLLTLVSLTQDAASELLYPLLPLLITGVLAAPPVVLGVIEGCAEAAAGISKYVAGRWSDRAGRRPFVTTGYALAAAGKIIVAAAFGWPMVLIGRVVDRLGKGVRSAPRDALIADSVPPEAYGRAFGFHRMGDSIGAVIGPLLALLALGALNGDVRAALWWAVVPALISVGLTLFVVDPRRRAARSQSPHGGVVTSARRSQTSPEEPPITAAAESAQPVEGLIAGIPKSPLPRSFWRITVLLVAIAVVNFPDVLLLLRVSDLGFSTTEVVLAYVVFNLVYTLGAYPAGALSDRVPRAAVYGFGLLAFAVGYIGLGLVTGGPAVFVLVAVYGLFPALTDGVGKAWISSLVPSDLRGRAQGVFQALGNGAVFLAGLWAGLLWTLGPGGGVVPLLFAGSVAGVAGIALLVWRRALHTHESELDGAA